MKSIYYITGMSQDMTLYTSASEMSKNARSHSITPSLQPNIAMILMYNKSVITTHYRIVSSTVESVLNSQSRHTVKLTLEGWRLL